MVADVERRLRRLMCRKSCICMLIRRCRGRDQGRAINKSIRPANHFWVRRTRRQVDIISTTLYRTSIIEMADTRRPGSRARPRLCHAIGQRVDASKNLCAQEVKSNIDGSVTRCHINAVDSDSREERSNATKVKLRFRTADVNVWT